MKLSTEQLVEAITDYVNTFGDKSEEFNALMSTQHRTLQQSFSKLVLGWVEHVGSNDYRTDGRNEGSHNVCKELLQGFRELKEKENYSESIIDLMSKPSGYCSCI